VPIAVALAMALAASLGAQSPDAGARADAATVRLAPKAFRGLPVHIRADLERRGCTIPQAAGPPYFELARRPHNVIKGRFRNRKELDWAVLCSRNRVSSILVFRGGSTRHVDEIRQSADRHFLQWMGPVGIAFSRVLHVASPTRIRQYYEAFGGPKPPRMDHDGIEDAYRGKASTVLYRHAGRWLELTGMD
jgi:hypothetical protein